MTGWFDENRAIGQRWARSPMVFLLVLLAVWPTEDLKAAGDSAMSSAGHVDAEMEDLRKDVGSRTKFYPSTTSSSTTLGHFKLGWQPSPGAELDEYGWVNNTISLGLGDRIEVGIKPIVYLSVYSTKVPEIRDRRYYQLQTKWNFYRSSTFNAAVSYGYERFSFSFDIDRDEFGLKQTGGDSTEAEGETYTLPNNVSSVDHYFALLMDYWVSPNHAFALNVNYRYNEHFDKAYFYGANRAFNQNRWVHYRGDYMYSYSDAIKITTGVSRRYGFLIEEFEKDDALDLSSAPILYGAGATVTWVRPRMTFSSPSIGFHHYIEKGMTQVMFGTNFY